MDEHLQDTSKKHGRTYCTVRWLCMIINFNIINRIQRYFTTQTCPMSGMESTAVFQVANNYQTAIRWNDVTHHVFVCESLEYTLECSMCRIYPPTLPEVIPSCSWISHRWNIWTCFFMDGFLRITTLTKKNCIDKNCTKSDPIELSLNY